MRNTGAKKIGAHITLDGEKEFKTAVSSCNKELSTMKSEMKLVEAQTVGSANSISTLKKKHDVLTRTLEEQVRKEEEVCRGLTHATEEYERVGRELSTYKEKLAQAKSTLQEMKDSSETSNEALEEQQKIVAELTSIVEKGEGTYQRAGNRVQDWKKQLNNAQAQTIKATRALNENNAYMREAETATDGCAKSIDQFGKQTSKLADEITSASKILKVNLINTLVDAGKNLTADVFRSAIQGTVELQEAQSQLRASTGLTTKETKKYNEEMQNLYKEGYAENINEVADAMALVKQYTNETDPSKLKEMAENGIALQDVFSIDLSESIRGADALVTTMGVDGQKAFDLMAKGAQNGLNKSGELADNIAEYAQLWGQAGFSAEEMFAILENGLDSGAYNLDKVNDYVKEFGNSLADGRIEENINAFSGNTRILFQEWQNGNATAKQVFQSVISDLASMENQQQALTIASNVWSALGEDNAMKVITSLNNANDAYKDVKGTMEEIKKIKYDNVASQWKVLGRTFQTDVIQPVLVKFLPKAQKGMEILADNIDVIAPIATASGVAIGTMFVVNKSRKFISEVKETGKCIKDLIAQVGKSVAVKTIDTAAETAGTAAAAAHTVATTAQTTATVAQATATTTATAAQEGLNVAMAANPAGLIIAGIGAAVGIMALFSSATEKAYKKTDELGKKTEEINKKIKESTEGISKSLEETEKALSDLDTKETASGKLVTELYELDKASEKTAAQIKRMSIITMELNAMFPDLSLSVDENTGALNKNEQQTKKMIETSLKLAKAQAAQEKMVDISKELVEADMARAEAEENLRDIGEKLEELGRKRIEIEKEGEDSVKNGTESYSKYNGALEESKEALLKVINAEGELLEMKEKQEGELEKLNEKYDEANEKYEKAYEYTESLTGVTEGNTDSINQNTEAKQAAQEAASISIEKAGEELEAYNNLSVAQQDMATNVTNAVLTMQENVQGALGSQMDMFEKFDGGVEISTGKLLSNMQSQVDGVTQWEQNLSALADKGINQGILQKLAEMGPQGSGYVAAFNAMTDEELSKANELWKESIDIKGMTNKWGQQLLDSGAANVAGGMDKLTPILQQSGANTVLGLVQGMQQAQKMSETAGRDLGIKTVESIDNGLGCHSPSTKTMESGRNVNQGLINGMIKNAAQVRSAAKETGDVVVKQISTSLTSQKFVQYGNNVASGLARGITQGKSKAVNATIEMAKEVIRAAKSTLEINSPSRVFRGMGNNSMDSYALGVEERRSVARKTVVSAMNFKNIKGKMTDSTIKTKENDFNMLKAALSETMENIKFVSYLNGREITRELSKMGVAFRAEL